MEEDVFASFHLYRDNGSTFLVSSVYTGCRQSSPLPRKTRNWEKCRLPPIAQARRRGHEENGVFSHAIALAEDLTQYNAFLSVSVNDLVLREKQPPRKAGTSSCGSPLRGDGVVISFIEARRLLAQTVVFRSAFSFIQLVCSLQSLGHNWS